MTRSERTACVFMALLLAEQVIIGWSYAWTF